MTDIGRVDFNFTSLSDKPLRSVTEKRHNCLQPLPGTNQTTPQDPEPLQAFLPHDSGIVRGRHTKR